MSDPEFAEKESWIARELHLPPTRPLQSGR